MYGYVIFPVQKLLCSQFIVAYNETASYYLFKADEKKGDRYEGRIYVFT
jgi:hypothetical protein